MSQTSDIAQVLQDGNAQWLPSSGIVNATGIDSSRVAALLCSLLQRGLVEKRRAAGHKNAVEYRVCDAEKMQGYLDQAERADERKRGIDRTDADDGAARVTRATGTTQQLPIVPTLADALLGSATPHPYVPAKRDADDTPRAALAQHDEPTRTTEQPATPGPAERDGEPIPAKETKPAMARSALTWAIDHRGKLILCLGDNAFELLPPQWTPLARFLAPLAGVFV